MAPWDAALATAVAAGAARDLGCSASLMALCYRAAGGLHHLEDFGTGEEYSIDLITTGQARLQSRHALARCYKDQCGEAGTLGRNTLVAAHLAEPPGKACWQLWPLS